MKYSVCLDALYPGVDLAQALPDIREAEIDTSVSFGTGPTATLPP